MDISQLSCHALLVMLLCSADSYPEVNPLYFARPLAWENCKVFFFFQIQTNLSRFFVLYWMFLLEDFFLCHYFLYLLKLVFSATLFNSDCLHLILVADTPAQCCKTETYEDHPLPLF